MNQGIRERERLQIGMMVFVCVGLGMLAWLRPSRTPLAPPRIPAAQAEPWMADGLPGVGAKTREHVATVLRSGNIEQIPHRAQEAARQMFVLP